MGVNFQNLSFDFNKMKKQKDTVISNLCKGIEKLFKANEIDFARGTAFFTGQHDIEITSNKDQSKRLISAENIIIASGSDFAPPPDSSLTPDEKIIVSSTASLDLPKIPKRMVIIGAGVTGMEIGCIYHQLGTKVIVIEQNARILPPADHEVSNYLERYLRRDGMEFITGHKAIGCEIKDNIARVVIESVKTNEKKIIDSDIVLVANGRIPVTKGLGIEKYGLKINMDGKIPVDDYLQVFFIELKIYS